MSDALVNGLAGAGGGIIAQIITYPLQAVNTRQQTERKAKNSIVQASQIKKGLLDDRQHKRSLGTYKELCKVLQQEGWEGLFRGLTPSLVGTATSQGVYYYFYQLFKDEAEAIALRRKRKGFGDGTTGMFSSLIVAALAGCLNVLLTNPIWVLVTRMQTHAQSQKDAGKGKEDLAEIQVASSSQMSSNALSTAKPYGTLTAIKDLYYEAGLKGFWKGVLPTLIMVSNPSIQFMLYEGMLKQLRKKRASNLKGLTNVTALEVFLLGAIAKLGATVTTYPLLVVKSRLQAKQEIGGDKAQQYSGTLDATLKILRFEGIGGFYKGMGTKILQSVFAAAVLFMVKEELVKSARILVTKKAAITERLRHAPN
eukprot:c14194_g1_i1 orf=218-1318(-)